MSIISVGSEKWNDEVKFFVSASVPEIKARAEELNVKYESYSQYMNHNGIHRNGSKVCKATSKNDEEFIVNLPKVNIKEYIPQESSGEEEIALLHCSDGHAGKITKSFNKEVYRDRMYKMFESTMRIVNLHRNMYPIKKLHIVSTGDNMQGENPFQGSKIGEAEMGARDQIKKLAIPVWNDVIGSFKQEFEEVEFDGFPGNHGQDKLAPATSNLDISFYDILEAGIGQYDGITINCHEEFADIININGFKFFCFHGDGIPCQQGIPYFSIDRKLKAWYIQYNGFNYALGGHFHKRHSDEIASKFEYFMCGSLVSDDEWVLKKLGISSNPSQWLMGVHPRHGVTWRYPLVVDDKFLPEKV